MDSKELRQKFISFFESRGHKQVASASLIPENDPSVLFTTAGMQQFKRFYLNPSDAPAQNVVTVQPCFRTSDIEEVGDETHLTMFEMLGNFSFGGYGKQQAIEYAYEFLTKELGIKQSRIWCSVFEGDDINPRDNESAQILESMGLQYKDHNREDNFWGPTGSEGPCGSTVEFYVDDIEIWNLVFNEYNKTADGTYEKLENLGIDTGMGLERMLVVYNKFDNVYETDLMLPVIKKIENIIDKKYEGDNIIAIRRIVDHLRSSIALINTGIKPGKNERESVLRTLLRVIFVEVNFLMRGPIELNDLDKWEAVNKSVHNMFNDWSDSIEELYLDQSSEIRAIVHLEYQSFLGLEKLGISYIKKYQNESIITGDIIFRGKDTFGLTPAGVVDLWNSFGIKISENWEEEYKQAEEKHHVISRSNIGIFKGGLAGGGEMETKLHTATHLLLASLRQILSSDVMQKGANITSERLRFDFNYPEKLTDEQIEKIENLVNEKITEKIPVDMEEMSLEDAKNCGALGAFGEKYGFKVKVYTMGTFSKEICGGPHVKNTSELGIFKITKEESSSAGVRRIKAILE